MKRAYSYYCNYSKQMDAAVTEYSRRTLEGPLRESAVARLLVEGKLPPDIATTVSPSSDNGNDPVDLSSKGRLQGTLSTLPIGAIGSTPPPPAKSVLSPPPNGVTIDGHEPTVDVLQRSLRREMDKLREAKSEVPGDWKCRYCPYVAPTSKTLYSHYQFHQQLLASQSSRAHLEWLSAYRKAKEGGLEGEGDQAMPFSYPPHPNLTYGVIRADKRVQPSASGFLKAIVKAVMQGKTTGEAVTSTSIYSTMTNETENMCHTILGSIDPHTPLSPMASRRKKRKLEPHSACPSAKDAKYEETCNEDKKVNLQELRFQEHYELGPQTVDTQSVFAAKINELLLLDRKPELPILDDVSSVKDTAPTFSTAKSSYLDNLPLRKRPKDGYFDQNLTQYVKEAKPRNLYTEVSREESDTESSTTTATIQETLEKDDITSPANFATDDDQDSVKSPGSVCSDIDVGTNDMYTSKTLRTHQMSGSSTNLSDNTREKTESEDGGHITLPLYRAYSIDSISSMESSSTAQMATDLSQTTWAMTELECISEEEGIISHRGVQCDILLPTSFPADPTQHRSSSPFSSSSSLSSSSEDSDCDTAGSRPTKRKRAKLVKCFHCGISFEDEVLHSIHMGCHSHTDPYNCNVCGQSCGNRYGFYTHIMRGHLPV